MIMYVRHMLLVCPIVRGYVWIRGDMCAMHMDMAEMWRMGLYPVARDASSRHPHTRTHAPTRTHPCARAYQRPPSISAELGHILASTSKRKKDLAIREVPSIFWGSHSRSVSRRAEGPPIHLFCTERTTFAPSTHLSSAQALDLQRCCSPKIFRGIFWTCRTSRTVCYCQEALLAGPRKGPDLGS